MNTKKFVLAFIVVYVLLELTNYLVHGVILASTYNSESVKELFRSDMMSNMWIIWVTDLIWSFFFVFFFVKGYENKGIMEGTALRILYGNIFCHGFRVSDLRHVSHPVLPGF